MWEEPNRKIKIKNKSIPEAITKFSKQEDWLEKLPWDSNRTMMENYQNALNNQNEYENLEIYGKLKHENKIVKYIRYNLNHYSNLLNQKLKFPKILIQ